MAMQINVERIIQLVKHNPTIWDRTDDMYNNKMAREHVWRQLSSQLNRAYDKMDKTQQFAYVKLIVKKWNQLRDSWIRDWKKRRQATNSGLYAPKRYKYYRHMSFLKKVVDGKSAKSADVKLEEEEAEEDDDDEVVYEEHLEVTDDSNDEETIAVNNDFDVTRNQSINVSKESRRSVSADPLTFMSEVQQEELVPVYRHDENDPLLHFFKGLHPITSTLTVDETLEFQSGVIGLLQRIKKQRQAGPYDSPQTSAQ